MLRFAQLSESIAATTKKNEKVSLVADYLRTTPVEESALAALYLCGRVFPRREERVLSICFSILLRGVASHPSAKSRGLCLAAAAAPRCREASPPRAPAPAPLRSGSQILHQNRH